MCNETKILEQAVASRDMKKYRIWSENSSSEYIKMFISIEHGKDWIIGTLDLSLSWNIDLF